MAALIETALARQASQAVGIVPIEAATGIGKTLAYLVTGAVHAAETNSRMLVSTHTIELGRQVVEEDGPVARYVAKTLTGHDPRIAHLRGRRNFASASRARSVGNLMRAEGLPKTAWEPYVEAADRMDKLTARAARLTEGSDTSLEAELVVRNSLLDHLEQEIGTSLARDDICLLATSPEAERSVHELGLRLAETASVLVTTHAYTAVSLARRRFFGSHETPLSLLIVDEADQWAAAAASASLLSVSLQTLARAIERMQQAGRHSPNANALGRLGDDALVTIERMRELAPQERDVTRTLGPDDRAVSLLGMVGRQLDEIVAAAVTARHHTAAAAGALSEQVAEIGRIRKALGSNEHDFWVPRWSTSRIQGLPSIEVAGKAPGRILRRLWAGAEQGEPLARTIVLTSATLSTPGFGEASRWRSIEAATGVDPSSGTVLTDLASILQPRRFGRMRVRFADPRAPVPRLGEDGLIPREALAYIAQVLKAATTEAREGQGRTLVLVPSYNDVEQLSGLVPEALTHRQGTPLKGMLKLYKDTPGCTLITPAAWVGVNLPGLIQHLVIPRIPFTPNRPGDTLNVPQLLSSTLNKLSQGIGRGLRRDADDVTLWFADARVPVPDCITEDTGLLRSEHAVPALLAAIPSRFVEAFTTAPGAASIGVPFETDLETTHGPSTLTRNANGRTMSRRRSSKR